MIRTERQYPVDLLSHRFRCRATAPFVECLRLLFFALILCNQSLAKDKPDNDLKHGSLEFLQQSLVRSPEDARLLAAAANEFARGDKDLAFVALHRIFDQPHDSFLSIEAGRPISSTYSAALEMLQDADFATRAAWTASVEPVARKKLEIALAYGSAEQLRKVAMAFPFTASAFKAQVSRTLLASTNGQHRLAAARLSDLEQTYGLGRLSFPTHQTLASLKHRLNSQPPPAAPLSVTNTSPDASSVGLAHPWPNQLWEWHESVWAQPQFATAVEGITLPEHYDLLRTNSWQPTLQGETLYLRTPLRVAAFNKHDGSVIWSVQTDTLHDIDPIREESVYPSSQQRLSTASLMRMDDLGSLAVDRGYVFFVDHFRKFAPSSSASYIRNRPQIVLPFNRGRNSAMEFSREGGTRLVAIRLKPQPHVAWTVGDAPPFNYQVSNSLNIQPLETSDLTPESSADDQSLKSEARDDIDLELNDVGPQSNKLESFQGQSFLGVPLIHDDMLFALSADSEMIWLSCLAQSSGRIIWKKPLLYKHETDLGQFGSYLLMQGSAVGASICGIDGTTVISALQSGVVIGTDLLDGRLLWATNLRDEPADIRDTHKLLRMAANKAIEGINSRPLIANGKLIWTAPRTSRVHCLNTQNGEILWTVDRSVEGFGAAEGSMDCYCLVASEEHAVMLGERHIRALNLTDGSQVWSRMLQEQTGRATSDGAVCLVPQKDGTIATFDVATGLPGLPVSQIFGSAQAASAGTLVADEDVVCVATPVSVKVLPTTQYHQSRQHNNSPTVNALTDARIDLLTSKTVSGLDKLEAILKKRPEGSERQAAADLLAETLLSLMATVQLEPESAARLTMPTDTNSKLNNLPLTVEQRIRHKILAPDEAVLGPIGDLSQLPLLQISPDWSARADVMAWSTLSHEVARQIAPLEAPGRGEFGRIEHAILFPEQLGSLTDQLEFAESLTKAHRFEAAELVLLATLDSVGEADRNRVTQELRRLRSQRFASPAVSERPARKPGLGKPIQNIKIEEKLSLTARSKGGPALDALSVVGNRSMASILATPNTAVDTPQWYSNRLFIISRQLFPVDPMSGAIGTPQKLPASLHPVQVEDNFETPALIPLIERESRDNDDYVSYNTQMPDVDSGAVGMLSLLAGDTPRVLWWKRMKLDQSDRSPLQVGSIGPGYMIVAASTTLHCLHPFTGQVLWKRRLPQSPVTFSPFLSSNRLFGDGNVTVVMGETQRTCQRFRTRDGYKMAPVRIDIPEGQRPIISGRKVLFTLGNALVLFDLLTGENTLKGKPKIHVLPTARAWQLPNHRVVVLTPELEVVVFNMESGTADLRCSLSDSQTPDRIKGLSAFERDGDLFVVIQAADAMTGTLSASSRIGEPRLEHGTLYRIDGQNGEIKWWAPSQPAVMPTIYGDPTDLILTWSTEHSDRRAWEHNFGQFRNNRGASGSPTNNISLLVRVLDGRTGETIATQSHLTPSEPLRCVHDADSETIKMETGMSEITIRYSP